MKKHILSVLFLLILTLGCSLSVFAEEEPTKYIVDEMGVLSDDEIDELNAYADYLSAETGIDSARRTRAATKARWASPARAA